MRRSTLLSAIKKTVGQFSPDTEVILYGSEARKEARHNSDVDLLVLIKKDKISIQDEEAIFSPLYQIELEYGVLINPLIMSRKEWESRVTPFSETVKREGIILWPKKKELIKWLVTLWCRCYPSKNHRFFQ